MDREIRGEVMGGGGVRRKERTEREIESERRRRNEKKREKKGKKEKKEEINLHQLPRSPPEILLHQRNVGDGKEGVGEREEVGSLDGGGSGGEEEGEKGYDENEKERVSE